MFPFTMHPLNPPLTWMAPRPLKIHITTSCSHIRLHPYPSSGHIPLLVSQGTLLRCFAFTPFVALCNTLLVGLYLFIFFLRHPPLLTDLFDSTLCTWILYYSLPFLMRFIMLVQQPLTTFLLCVNVQQSLIVTNNVQLVSEFRSPLITFFPIICFVNAPFQFLRLLCFMSCNLSCVFLVSYFSISVITPVLLCTLSWSSAKRINSSLTSRRSGRLGKQAKLRASVCLPGTSYDNTNTLGVSASEQPILQEVPEAGICYPRSHRGIGRRHRLCQYK